MAKEQYQRLPEEEIRNLNQVTNPHLARRLAEVEKPIRDLARDAAADPGIAGLRTILDREADRLASVEQNTSQRILSESIGQIRLSSDNLTTRLYSAAHQAGIETIADLVYKMRDLNVGQKTFKEVKEWLSSHGLKD